MKKKTTIITAGAAAAVLIGAGITVAVAEPFDDDSAVQLTGGSLDRASEAALAEVGQGTVTEAERSDDSDATYEVEIRLDAGGEAEVELDDSFDVLRVELDDARDNDRDDSDDDGLTSDDRSGLRNGATDTDDDAAVAALSPADREVVERTALDAVGGGTVTDIDSSDDADHAWEVEVTLESGDDVEVELDDSFAVVSVEGDSRAFPTPAP